MPTTPGRQAVIRHVEETTPGTTPTDPAFLLFSPETLGVTFGLDKEQQESLDIGELGVHEYFSLRNTYSIEVEYNLYDVPSGLFAHLARRADESPKAYTLEIIPNQAHATPTYYRGTGWRVNTVVLNAPVDGAQTVTVTFTGGTIADPTTTAPSIGSGSRETKAGYATRTSNAALKHGASGAVTIDGSATPLAVLVGSFEATWENGVEVSHTLGDADPVGSATRYGVQRITGNADISLDDAAAPHWLRVKNHTTHTLQLAFGATAGSDILVLEGVTFPSIEVSIEAETDILMGGQDWTALTWDEDEV